MKTLLRPLFLACTLWVISHSASWASSNPGTRSTTAASYKTGIYATLDGSLRIALDKEQTGGVDIKFKDQTGKVLFAQRLGKKEQQARIRLNLSDLPDGVYGVEISNGVNITRHEVRVSTPQPSTPSRLVALN